jgi:predicted helicase
MLLPYYIASLNIEHEFYERTGEYLPFEGIAFADTLNLESQQMELFSERNTERIVREKQAPIMVVIGNPPYNVGQVNENDNNKNRKYSTVDQRIKLTYARDSKASNKNALSDAYVKFFRWAVDRLQGRDGIVCFVSNNSFVDQIAFDGMRKNLLQDFTQIYHIDLHGNVRKNPKLSGTTHNVFGIQVGVGITIAIRSSRHTKRSLFYYRVPEFWHRTEKLAFLVTMGYFDKIQWTELHPDEKCTWITEGLDPEFTSLLPLGNKEARMQIHQNTQTIFKNYSLGISTARDVWNYNFSFEALQKHIKGFIETYNTEVDRWRRIANNSISVDDFVTYDDTKIKWSEGLKLELKRGRYAAFVVTKLRKSLYRPFSKKWSFFDRVLNERNYQMPQIFPTQEIETENAIIIAGGYGRKNFAVLISNQIPNYNFYGDPAQCFPFYTYNEDGSNRRENITDWALTQFRDKYGAEVTKWDIFHYVYAMLHHPQYRERYAENLKRDLPHIPLLQSKEAFLVCVRIGKRLMELHLNYEQAKEYPLKWVENEDVPFTWYVKRMRLTADKSAVVVNESLMLEGIPQECFAYRLGNRSALDWVIDQYQVSEDKRSGIVSDPNNLDDEEYIVRLVGKVVTVSVETVRLVKELAGGVGQGEWVG